MRAISFLTKTSLWVLAGAVLISGCGRQDNSSTSASIQTDAHQMAMTSTLNVAAGVDCEFFCGGTPATWSQIQPRSGACTCKGNISGQSVTATNGGNCDGYRTSTLYGTCQ